MVTRPTGQHKFSTELRRHFPTVKHGPAAMPQTTSARQASSAPIPQDCGCTRVPRARIWPLSLHHTSAGLIHGGATSPPKISTHAHLVRGWGKAALQEGLSLLQSESTGPLHDHGGSHIPWNEGRPSVWPNMEDMGKEKQETDLLLSLSIIE